jgi:hypothetical protein
LSRDEVFDDILNGAGLGHDDQVDEEAGEAADKLKGREHHGDFKTLANKCSWVLLAEVKHFHRGLDLREQSHVQKQAADDSRQVDVGVAGRDVVQYRVRGMRFIIRAPAHDQKAKQRHLDNESENTLLDDIVQAS